MGQDKPLSQTHADLLDEATDKLGDTGCETPKLDARLLLQHVCHVEHAGLISRMDELASTADAEAFFHLIEMRATGCPVHRIIGHREFYGHSFKLSPDTLEPRPDTECLIERVLADRLEFGLSPHFVDVGTGSGAIAISLLKALPEAKAVASDISIKALETAKLNANALGVSQRIEFVQSNYLEGLKGPFDFLVSNPPYIVSAEITKLEREVRDWDPSIALDGGGDGLDAYRAILRSAGSVLKRGGKLYLEIGYDQVTDLQALSVFYSLKFDGLIHDLGGQPRVVVLISR
ncbi:MAG: peptide chain release factor N(5)-glutamine methyltransferase [Rhizobiaceae bacterium]